MFLAERITSLRTSEAYRQIGGFRCTLQSPLMGCGTDSCWINRFRQIQTRRENKPENNEMLLHFACGVMVWNKNLLG